MQSGNVASAGSHEGASKEDSKEGKLDKSALYVRNMYGDRHWRDAICIKALAILRNLVYSVFVSPAGYRVEFNVENAGTKRRIHS